MATTKKRAPAKKQALKKKVVRVGDPIDAAIRKFEKKLRDEEIKLADYLRLLQIQKEREECRPRQITVRWIGTWEKEPPTDS